MALKITVIFTRTNPRTLIQLSPVRFMALMVPSMAGRKFTNVKLSMYTFDEIRMYKKPTLKTRDSLTQNKA